MRAEDDRFDVLCVGETMVMVTPAEVGRLDAHTRTRLCPGGAESNVAAHLAALGRTVAWAGQLGDDPFARIIVEELRAVGVDTSLVRRVSDAPTGVYFKDPGPEGTAVYYYRTGSAASRMSPATVAGWASVGAAVLHVSGITPSLSDSCLALTRHLVHERPIGDRIAFDVNHRAKLTTEATPSILLELAQASDIVFVGRDEAESLWGTPTAEAVRELLDRPTHVIVKDADVEAIEFLGDAVARIPSPRVDVVETVGAGDAFAAGWLSAYLDDATPGIRLALGHYVASHVLRSTTDHAPLGTPDDIAAALGRPTLDW